MALSLWSELEQGKLVKGLPRNLRHCRGAELGPCGPWETETSGQTYPHCLWILMR